MAVEENSSSNQPQTESQPKKIEQKYIGLPNQGLKLTRKIGYKVIRSYLLYE